MKKFPKLEKTTSIKTKKTSILVIVKIKKGGFFS